MDNRLEQLLLQKKFEELTAEEKYYVTESVGEAEYTRMHYFLEESRLFLKKTPRVNPALKGSLLAAFRKGQESSAEKKPAGIVRFLQYRVPAWQVAATIALLLAGHFWLQPAPQIIEKTDTVYVHTTDTIFKEVAMRVLVDPAPGIPRVNVNPKAQQIPAAREPVLIAAANTSLRRYESTEVPDTFSMVVSRPRGQSVTQAEDLWELLGEVY